MARQLDPRKAQSTSLVTRVAIGVAILVVAWLMLQFVIGAVFALIRAALFVALFGMIAWVVLVGPPDFRKR
jgi:membrane associated rhomboid family serine protease